MKYILQKAIFSVTNTLELFISGIVVLVITILSFRMLFHIPEMLWVGDLDTALSGFLSSCLNLIIGVELVKMLVRHSMPTAIEVLVFAVARQMIVEHQTPLQALLSIMGLAALFAVRKFLLKDLDLTEKAIYRANQKVKVIRALEHIEIPADPEETIGDVIKRELEEQGDEIGTGAVVSYKGFALKVVKRSGDVITRVEVIKELA